MCWDSERERESSNFPFGLGHEKDHRKSSLAPPKYRCVAIGIGLAGPFFRTQKLKFGKREREGAYIYICLCEIRSIVDPRCASVQCAAPNCTG